MCRGRHRRLVRVVVVHLSGWARSRCRDEPGSGSSCGSCARINWKGAETGSMLCIAHASHQVIKGGAYYSRSWSRAGRMGTTKDGMVHISFV